MGRHQSKFYCPKCNRKTLVRESRYDHAYTCWRRGYVCKNQIPRRWQFLADAIKKDDPDALKRNSLYQGYDARYGDEPTKTRERQKQIEKVKALLKKGECDCEIFAPGRDAEIVDYYTVLDLLIRPGDAIRHYLLEKNPDIHRKGFETLHSTETVDVVKLRDSGGVGVWLYWKCTWEADRSKNEIDWSSLYHQASGKIYHGEGEQLVSIRQIFRTKRRFQLWSKDDDDHPFTGNLGKKKKAQIVEWVKALEENLASYQEQAAAAVKVWEDWGRQLRAATAARSSKVVVQHYDGHEEQATIVIHGWLSQAQIEAVAEALGRTL